MYWGWGYSSIVKYILSMNKVTGFHSQHKKEQQYKNYSVIYSYIVLEKGMEYDHNQNYWLPFGTHLNMKAKL